MKTSRFTLWIFATVSVSAFAQQLDEAYCKGPKIQAYVRGHYSETLFTNDDGSSDRLMLLDAQVKTQAGEMLRPGVTAWTCEKNGASFLIFTDGNTYKNMPFATAGESLLLYAPINSVDLDADDVAKIYKTTLPQRVLHRIVKIK